MGHNLGDYPQGYAQVAFLEKTGLFLEKQGNFWRNRAIFGRSEPKAIGRRPEPGAPVEGLRTPRRRFRACFAISRFAGSPSRTDPARKQQGQINHHDGGPGVYFEDLNGHLLEVITRPYGSGGWNP
jgi:hypothetical protein